VKIPVCLWHERRKWLKMGTHLPITYFWWLRMLSRNLVSLWQLDPLDWLITCLFNHLEHVLSLAELYQTTPGSLDALMNLEITTLIVVITRLLLYLIIEMKPSEAHFKDKGGSTMCQSKPARYIVMCCRPSQSLVDNLVMHKFWLCYQGMVDSIFIPLLLYYVSAL